MSEAEGRPASETTGASPEAGIVAEHGFVPRCPQCDYVLIGLTLERCPECGRRFSLAQLRTMHLRRRQTPWEAPGYRGSAVRRFLATWRLMLRPPFFLFLARPMRARRAMSFALVNVLLVTVLWAAIAWAEGAYLPTPWRWLTPAAFDVLGLRGAITPAGNPRTVPLAFPGPGRFAPRRFVQVPYYAPLWVLEDAIFVPTAYLFLALFFRAGLTPLANRSEVSRDKTVVWQIVAYLSCWALAGLAVFALGVLGMILLDMQRPRWVASDFAVIPMGIAEFVLVAIWCCHADAAVRDGLQRKSKWLGPVLVLAAAPAAWTGASLLTHALMLALAGLL